MSTGSACSENILEREGCIDMTSDPGRQFNEIPNLPPASETETGPFLRSCFAARAALAELPVSGKLIPSQTMLINSIPVLEALASSEIGNIATTTDRLSLDQATNATTQALFTEQSKNVW